MQISFKSTFLDLNQILADAYCCHAARPSNITHIVLLEIAP